MKARPARANAARWVAVLGWLGLLAPVGAFEDKLTQYVASLNQPKTRSEFGVARVRLPERAANTLEVQFDRDVSPLQRAEFLHKIGGEFLVKVFQEHGITTATVLEVDASGHVVDRSVVQFGAQGTEERRDADDGDSSGGADGDVGGTGARGHQDGAR